MGYHGRMHVLHANWSGGKLHLWADSDPIIPFRVGERFAAAVHGAPPEKIENASHFLQEDAGEEIGARIAAWLADTEVTA